MKKGFKVSLLAILPVLILVLWFMSDKQDVKAMVKEGCSQFEVGDEWVGCVIDLAVTQKDAKYCETQNIFSPYPGICMEKFAEQTEDKESCYTIGKQRYQEECLGRFI